MCVPGGRIWQGPGGRGWWTAKEMVCGNGMWRRRRRRGQRGLSGKRTWTTAVVGGGAGESNKPQQQAAVWIRCQRDHEEDTFWALCAIFGGGGGGGGGVGGPARVCVPCTGCQVAAGGGGGGSSRRWAAVAVEGGGDVGVVVGGGGRARGGGSRVVEISVMRSRVASLWRQRPGVQAPVPPAAATAADEQPHFGALDEDANT